MTALATTTLTPATSEWAYVFVFAVMVTATLGVWGGLALARLIWRAIDAYVEQRRRAWLREHWRQLYDAEDDISDAAVRRITAAVQQADRDRRAREERAASEVTS